MKGAVFLLLVAAVSPLPAHHSFAAEFDSSKPLTLIGTVTRVNWTNPHVFLFVDVKGRDGKTINWRLESLAPNGLIREGWYRESLKVGDRVTIEAFQAKDEEHFAKTTWVLLPGGRKINTGSADERGQR